MRDWKHGTRGEDLQCPIPAAYAAEAASHRLSACLAGADAAADAVLVPVPSLPRSLKGFLEAEFLFILQALLHGVPQRFGNWSCWMLGRTNIVDVVRDALATPHI